MKKYQLKFISFRCGALAGERGPAGADRREIQQRTRRRARKRGGIIIGGRSSDKKTLCVFLHREACVLENEREKSCSHVLVQDFVLRRSTVNRFNIYIGSPSAAGNGHSRHTWFSADCDHSDCCRWTISCSGTEASQCEYVKQIQVSSRDGKCRLSEWPLIIHCSKSCQKGQLKPRTTETKKQGQRPTKNLFRLASSWATSVQCVSKESRSELKENSHDVKEREKEF
ncbi:hypothetical protein R1flu_018081 [Riccia fluitans]|uniref:Uncharacterized protein n=1 Tax=Riccia fluitans TaxID=41844 RepID=A0ABD1ZF13_9MARC